MSYDPWSAIIGQIVQGAARNMKETGKGAQQAEKGGYAYDNQSPQMTYQQAPQMQSNATSPTGNLTAFAVPGMTRQQQGMVPVIGQALQGEEAMLRNVQSAPGAYQQAPTEPYDSRKPLFSSRYSGYGI